MCSPLTGTHSIARADGPNERASPVPYRRGADHGHDRCSLDLRRAPALSRPRAVHGDILGRGVGGLAFPHADTHLRCPNSSQTVTKESPEMLANPALAGFLLALIPAVVLLAGATLVIALRRGR